MNSLTLFGAAGDWGAIPFKKDSKNSDQGAAQYPGGLVSWVLRARGGELP